MPPKPLPKELTGDIQTTPSPLFPTATPFERQHVGDMGTTFFQRFKQNLAKEGPGLLGTAVSGVIPGSGALGMLARIAAGSATAGGTRKLLGGEFSGEAGKFAAGQIPAELGFGVARLGIGQQRAGQALRKSQAGFEDALRAHAESLVKGKADFARAQEQHAATVAQQQAGFQASTRAYAEQGATSIADAFKSSVPAWKEFPANEKGLADMVYGKGQARLSESFDVALKDVIQSGTGKPVKLALEDAETLGLNPMSHGPLSQVAQQLKATPAEMQGMFGGHAPNTPIDVDGGALAKKAVGLWKKDRELHRRVFQALDTAGLGNEAARNEYKTGQALIDFIDKGKVFKEGAFDPEAARKALYSLKTVDTLRKRGEGDVFRGPIAEAVQGPAPKLPPAPPKPQAPVEPLKPEKPDIGIKKSVVSPMTKFHIGGGIGMAGTLPFGGMHGGWPYIGGGLAGQAILPKSVYTGPGVPNPTTPPMLPSTIAEMLRLYFTQKAQPPTTP